MILRYRKKTLSEGLEKLKKGEFLVNFRFTKVLKKMLFVKLIFAFFVRRYDPL